MVILVVVVATVVVLVFDIVSFSIHYSVCFTVTPIIYLLERERERERGERERERERDKIFVVNTGHGI